MLRGFKNFLLRGDVIVIAIGLIVATAFSNLVKSFTSDVITPIINRIQGSHGFGFGIQVGKNGNIATFINLGDLLSVIVYFFIFMLVIYFLLVQPYKGVQARRGVTVFGDPAPAKTCQYCLAEDLPVAATRCRYCTLRALGRRRYPSVEDPVHDPPSPAGDAPVFIPQLRGGGAQAPGQGGQGGPGGGKRVTRDVPYQAQPVAGPLAESVGRGEGPGVGGVEGAGLLQGVESSQCSCGPRCRARVAAAVPSIRCRRGNRLPASGGTWGPPMVVLARAPCGPWCAVSPAPRRGRRADPKRSAGPLTRSAHPAQRRRR